MTAEPVGEWDEGRDALRRHDWQSAYDALSSAGAASADDPEALQDLAEAAWWLGKLDECIAARELAYEAYEAAGDSPRAVRVAARLFDDHCFKGRPAIAHATQNGLFPMLVHWQRHIFHELEDLLLLVRPPSDAHLQGARALVNGIRARDVELVRGLTRAFHDWATPVILDAVTDGTWNGGNP